MAKEPSAWDKNQEGKHKIIIEKFFSRKLKSALKRSKNPLQVGDDIATILEKSDKEVVKIVTPRAIRKWASERTLKKWQRIINDPRMLMELRIIGKSIANTMRPLAGNNFALWITKILNTYFEDTKLPLKAIMKGKIKAELSRKFRVKIKGQQENRDYKPDIDIILVRSDLNEKAVAIISSKTTLAERVMQTISWSRFLKSKTSSMKKIKIYLVTAWDTFEMGTNRERVQELDGVYVCNKEVSEYGKIKRFSKIGEELKRLCC